MPRPITKASRFGRQPLADILQASGKTQMDLSRATGLSPARINSLCVGRTRPRIDTATKIARALGVKIEDLFTDVVLLGEERLGDAEF